MNHVPTEALRGPIKLAVYPCTNSNPYLDLFYGAVAPHGAERAGHVDFSERWLRESARDFDAVHFHWCVELIWRRHVPRFKGDWRLRQILSLVEGREAERWHGPVTSRARDACGVRMLDRFLASLHRQRVRVIWTLHDIEPHEGASRLDRRGYQVLARHSDLIICHTEGTREEAMRRYRPQCEVVVMPHGNYDGVYPPPRDREQVLTELGLDPSQPMVCCLGRIRDYKGLDLACEAVARCKGGQLLIAGTVQQGFDLDDLPLRVRRLERAVLIDRRITDQEFADFVAASEAVLLPYRKITGSGALLTAWTLRRGVIASDLDYFREMIPVDSQAGCLFRQGDAEALAAAIERYLADLPSQRSDAARAMADRYAWDECVLPVTDVFRRWYPNRISAPMQATPALALPKC